MPKIGQLHSSSLKLSSATVAVIAVVVIGYTIIHGSQAAGTLNGHAVTLDTGGKLTSWVSPQLESRKGQPDLNSLLT